MSEHDRMMGKEGSYLMTASFRMVSFRISEAEPLEKAAASSWMLFIAPLGTAWAPQPYSISSSSSPKGLMRFGSIAGG